MSITQYLRIIWTRKWLVLALLLVTIAVGTAVTLLMPKQYTADASLVVDVRVDPVMGMLAPALASPAYMATQVEILKSDRVASRVVKMLGVERSPAAVQQWRESTEAKIPLERYFANLLEKGLAVEPSRGSNVINITFASPDAAFAAGAADFDAGIGRMAGEFAADRRHAGNPHRIWSHAAGDERRGIAGTGLS